MAEFEPIDLHRGSYGELTPQSMAVADRLRLGLVQYSMRSAVRTEGRYVEPNFGSEPTDESLLTAHEAWQQSEDIWE